MRHRLRLTILLSALGAASACACAKPVSYTGPFAEDALPPAACAPGRGPAFVDTSGWRRHGVLGDRLSILVPPGFAPQSGFIFMHGGTRWRRDGQDIEEFGGHFGYGSFRPYREGARFVREFRDCEYRLGPYRVFEAVTIGQRPRRADLVRWIREESTGASIAIAARGSPRDLPLLWTVLASLALTPSAAPVSAQLVRPLGQVNVRVTAGPSSVASSAWTDVETFIRSRESQFRFCYIEQGLKLDPALTGQVNATVAFGTDGRVEAVELQGAPGGWHGAAATAVEACLRDRIRSWRFPSGLAGSYEVAMDFRRDPLAR